MKTLLAALTLAALVGSGNSAAGAAAPAAPKSGASKAAGTEPSDTAKAGLTKVPELKKGVKPIYPPEMYTLKMTGTVVVGFTIDPKGNVVDAWAVSSPDPKFSEAAVAAVKQFKFSPGMKDGKVVSTRMEVPIEFKYSETPVKKPDPAAKKSEPPAAKK